MQKNKVSSSVVRQSGVVLVSTDWYSLVSLCQLKELSTYFVTLQYISILLSTCQYTIVQFCKRCFWLSLQQYLQNPLHFSTFLFDFFTRLIFGFLTILPDRHRYRHHHHHYQYHLHGHYYTYHSYCCHPSVVLYHLSPFAVAFLCISLCEGLVSKHFWLAGMAADLHIILCSFPVNRI